MNLSETNRQYFTNILYYPNAAIEWDSASLKIPNGFTGQLTPWEKSMLLSDQLLYRGLMLDDMVFDKNGKICSRAIRADKYAKPLEEKYLTPNLKEYLEKYWEENGKKK